VAAISHWEVMLQVMTARFDGFSETEGPITLVQLLTKLSQNLVPSFWWQFAANALIGKDHGFSFHHRDEDQDARVGLSSIDFI
jgi:hypothetical protein